MKLFFRLFGVWLLLGCASAVWAQPAGPKIDRVDMKYVGPASVSEQFIRSNIRLKAGDIYLPAATQDDIQSLYATGQFYNIRVTVDPGGRWRRGADLHRAGAAAADGHQESRATRSSAIPKSGKKSP